MTATLLRYILIGLIVLMLGGFTAGAWWLQGKLAEDVRAIDHIEADAEVAAAELQQLKDLKEQLQNEQDVVARAKQIAANPDQYQDRVIQDVSAYAAKYGIAVNNFDFSAASGQQNASGNTAAFNVTLRGPVPYLDFMRLLQDLEDNLPKINVTSLSLSPASDPTLIATPALNLEVYLAR